MFSAVAISACVIIMIDQKMLHPQQRLRVFAFVQLLRYFGNLLLDFVPNNPKMDTVKFIRSLLVTIQKWILSSSSVTVSQFSHQEFGQVETFPTIEVLSKIWPSSKNKSHFGSNYVAPFQRCAVRNKNPLR